ncbi:MAG: hypothetical protein GY705_29455 [Bacteroidetes bacterium]|nr:hypothetical protein [Bacteroidota bacterium]
MKLSTASINCRGLKKNLKRRNIFKYCKKYDIACLQETHISRSDATLWEMEWGGQLFFSECSERSKGQVIILNKTLETEHVEVVFKSERILALEIKLKQAQRRAATDRSRTKDRDR